MTDYIQFLKSLAVPELLFSRPVIDLTVRRDVVVNVEQYAPDSERYAAIDRVTFDADPESGWAIVGRGATKAEAVSDLLDRLAEKEQS